jgi:hypothetical protein
VRGHCVLEFEAVDGFPGTGVFRDTGPRILPLQIALSTFYFYGLFPMILSEIEWIASKIVWSDTRIYGRAKVVWLVEMKGFEPSTPRCERDKNLLKTKPLAESFNDFK